MTTRRSREVAYGDLVAGLLDVRPDPATERFDAELAAAVNEGRIDLQTARVLRWWQRESLRAIVEHARAVVPPTLMALEASVAGAEREVDVSSRSWARAAGDEGFNPQTGTYSAGAQLDDGDPRLDAGTEPLPDLDGGTPAPAADPGLTPPTDLSDHRRRLLVAGLTRVRT